MGLVVEAMPEIGVTRISRWIFNCYVIHDGGQGGVVVVDAGLPNLASDLRRVFADARLEVDAVAAIVATHAHSDHVGGTPALAAATNARVYLPARVRAYLDGARPRTPSLNAVARIWPTAFDQPFDAAGALDAARGARAAGYGSAAGMRWPVETEVGFFDDGDALPGAPAWQVVGAPGHTDDSVAFWHAASGTLLSGDAVLSVRGQAWITPETVDAAANAQTAERLSRLPVDHLLPGHGRPVHGRSVMASVRPAGGARRKR